MFFLSSSHEHDRSWSSDIVLFAVVPQGGRWRVSVLKLGEDMGTLEFHTNVYDNRNLRCHLACLAKSTSRTQSWIYIFKVSWFHSGALALFQTNILYWMQLIVIVAVPWPLKAWCIVIRASSIHKWPLSEAKSSFGCWVFTGSWKVCWPRQFDFNLKWRGISGTNDKHTFLE